MIDPGTISRPLCLPGLLLQDETAQETGRFCAIPSVVCLLPGLLPCMKSASNLSRREVFELTNARLGPLLRSGRLIRVSRRKSKCIFASFGFRISRDSFYYGMPRWDALAVYQMAQLNWLTQARERDRIYFSYIGDWLYGSSLLNDLKTVLARACSFQDIAGLKISPCKTWMSSTSSAVRRVRNSWAWEGCRL